MPDVLGIDVFGLIGAFTVLLAVVTNLYAVGYRIKFGRFPKSRVESEYAEYRKFSEKQLLLVEETYGKRVSDLEARLRATQATLDTRDEELKALFQTMVKRI